MGYIRVYLGDVLQDQLELETDRLTIGRAVDNNLVLNDPGVWSHHAVIVREDNRFYIEGNESANGVFLSS